MFWYGTLRWYRCNMDAFTLANFILLFLKVLPQQHKTILLGKEHYTGDLKVEIDYKRNPKKLSAQLFEIEEFFGLQKRLEIVIKLCLSYTQIL